MDDLKVLTKQEAEAIVRAHLERISKSDPRGVEVEIVSDATIERPFGWVFFYNSVEFLRTGKLSSMLAGNAPIIINKQDGVLCDTGTAYPVEHYIKNYEEYGTPYPPTDLTHLDER
ncbi:MAG: hypothetical protein KDA54_09970 [Phycisphaerales bacterium]|nr:hypothetical protein [Phycisphaerales bacterium]